MDFIIDTTGTGDISVLKQPEESTKSGKFICIN